MDLDEFRSFVLDSGLDVWTWIDMAISMAFVDYENELKNRRDGIIQRLYATSSSKCQNCDHQLVEGAKCKENEIYQQGDVGCDYNSEKMANWNEADEDGDNDNDDDDYENREILEIKILLDDQNQAEKSLIDLLHRLVDMDITFKVLEETDIGRHVTRLRKHSSNEVRRLVKNLVRKWKDIVDKWLSTNTPMEDIAQLDGNKDSSPQMNNLKNGETGASNILAPCYLTPPKGTMKDKQICSTPKHFYGNHQEEDSQNAKRQRTAAKAMDFHHVPKTKNAAIHRLASNNKPGLHVKH